MNPSYSKSRHDITPLTPDEVAALAARLSPEAFRVTQKAGTERPFCGTLLDNKKDGIYACVVCGLPLFSADHKFNSQSGWPSFYREVDPEHVSRRQDRGYGMARTEIACARCGAHLGHVFDDGPEPTGERHCLNSASLVFHENGSELPPETPPVEPAVALEIICGKSKGDATIKLASELIAAILNVAQGADDACAADLITQAQEFLFVVPVGSDPKGDLKKARPSSPVQPGPRKHRGTRCFTPTSSSNKG